jgi:hypothetical protein
MFWVPKENDGPFEIVEKILGGILPIVLIIIGTIGNIICIICLLRRKHRRAPATFIYLIFLFSADTLSLYQWNLNYVVILFGNERQLSNKSLFLCKSVAFLSFYTLHSSAIFLTLVSIDRTLVLWSRYYRFHMAKRLQAFIISIIVLIILFAIDGFVLSLGLIDENTHKVICYYSLNANLMDFYINIYPWIHLILMYIIPFIIMIIGIILIIIKLFNRRINARHVHHKHRLSLMLIGMCIVYMVLTLPNRLCFSVFLSDILNHVYTDTILLASNTLLYTRNATNIFFLYIGSAKFRRQLAKSCHYCCCYRCQQRIRVAPVQSIQNRIGTGRFPAAT